MEENKERKYYPTYFLLVTGFSFLLFALFPRLIDGEKVRFFWWTGGITFMLGLLTGILFSCAEHGKDKIPFSIN